MKLRIVNMYAKLKVLIKFGSLEIVFVKMRSKKLFKLSLNQYTICET